MARGKRLGRKTRQETRSRQIEHYKTAQHKIMHLLHYGILAPSTHNTQPWKLKVIDDAVELYADFSKKIPEADPSGRDMYISLGAFIENVALAAKEHGVTLRVDVAGKLGTDEHTATLRFSNLDQAKDPAHSKMLDAIVNRQNYRGLFGQDVPIQEIAAILKRSSGEAVNFHLVTDARMKEKLAGLTAEGLRMGYARRDFRREIGSLINHNLSSKRHGLHGYSLRMNLRTSLIVPKVIKRKDIGPKLAGLNYKSFMSAPGAVVITAADNEAAWLQAGRSLERAMVGLTAAGIASSIYAAAIEMESLRSQVAKQVSLGKGEKPQLIFCIGTAMQPLPHSVRKKLNAVLVR